MLLVIDEEFNKLKMSYEREFIYASFEIIYAVSK